jgi:uncharacterized protein YbaP (TraB family)
MPKDLSFKILSLKSLARAVALVKTAVLPALFVLATGSCVHTAAREPVARPLLWAIEKDGRTSYLFGTMHVGVDAETDLPPAVWDAFRRSSCFVMEADQGAVDPRALLAMATLPKGESLEHMVKPETWAKLVSDLDGKLPPGVLARSKPWFITIVYLQQELPKGPAMDGVFQAKARAAGKRIDYLEDWREAMTAFASVTTQEDLDDLVLKRDESEAETEELVQAYRSGDETQVRKAIDAINADTPNSAAKLKALLEDRNAAWQPRLIKSAAKGGCFVAVGAGHLVGPGNLRDLLAKAGYRVRRVGGDGARI